MKQLVHRALQISRSVARAAGAHGVTVSSADELPQVLKDALAVVHGGRSAVVSAQLPQV